MTKKDTLPYSTVLIVDAAERDKTSIVLIIKVAKHVVSKNVKAQALPKLLDDILIKNKLLPADINALALVKRDGSMTAIRIATAVINTFAWLNKIPIIELRVDTIDLAVKKVQSGKLDKLVKISKPFA